MAGVRISGMASGLPPNIVEQLMEAERIPVKQMEAKKTKTEDKLKLVNDLESKVRDIEKNIGELAGAGGFMDKKLTSGDPNVVDGVADPAIAVPGDYQIEVIQLAQKPGAVSNGFPDRNKTELGVGYIKFNTSEGTKEVYVSGANSTLDGVVAQINNANMGFKAQVIEDKKDKENPFRLMISGMQTGGDNQVEFPTVYMLDGDQDMYFERSMEARNAIVKMDGFEIELPENQTTTLIPGVTVDLRSAAPGRPIRMSIKENLEVISGKVKSFVDAYNAALGFIQDQHKLKATGSGKQGMGPLGGDGMLRTVESALRRVIMNQQYGVESPITRISEIGIEFNRNGTLDFKQERFNKMLNSNPKAVANFLRGDNFTTGFVTTLKREIFNLTNGQFGVLGNRKQGMQTQITQMNERIDKKERQLEQKEESLRRKFSDLEQKMSGLNAQGQAFQAMGKQQQG